MKGFHCRYCQHLKEVNKARTKYIGMCEYHKVGVALPNPRNCDKFELAKSIQEPSDWLRRLNENIADVS